MSELVQVPGQFAFTKPAVGGTGGGQAIPDEVAHA